jgi:hypothetical protein
VGQTSSGSICVSVDSRQEVLSKFYFLRPAGIGQLPKWPFIAAWAMRHDFFRLPGANGFDLWSTALETFLTYKIGSVDALR